VRRNPRFWTFLAIGTFTALIVLPRALRESWPPWLTFVLAVASCVLLVTSWVVAKQMTPRTGLIVGSLGILLVAGAAALGLN
jgi:peptidoglycan/LPS O-acetylase OafA/YrhL